MSDATGALTSSKAQAAPLMIRAARSRFTARLPRQPQGRRSGIGLRPGAARSGSAPRPPARCSNRPPSPIPNKPLAEAARSPTTATRRRPSTCACRATRRAIRDWRILSVQGTTLDKLGRGLPLRRHRAQDRARRAVETVESWSLLQRRRGACAMQKRCGAPMATRGQTAGCDRTWRWWWAGGPLRGSRDHRQGRSAGRRGSDQCGLPSRNAEPQGQGQFALRQAVPVAALNRPD